MAVEFKKFEERFKKLEKDVQASSKAEADKLINQLNKIDTAIEGLDGLMEAIAKARSNGNLSDHLSGYMKDKEVKFYVSAMTQRADDVEEAVAKVKTMSELAEALEPRLKTLDDDIATDLKERSKLFSGSRKDIEALQKKIRTALSDVRLTKAYFSSKVLVPQKEFRERLLVKMENQVSEAIDRGDKGVKETKTTADLRDRKVAQNAARARDLANEVIEACKSAEKAAETGPKAAAPHLQEAQKSFRELVKLDQRYQELKRENEAEIKEAIGPEKIFESIDRINRAHVAADKQLKATMKAIRELMG